MSTFQFMPTSTFALDSCHGSVLVFVDSELRDYWKLANGLEAGAEGIVLHAHSDGIEQITSTLLTNTNIDSVHILASGSPGCIKLGHSLLSTETLDRYAQDLQIWFFLSQLCDRHPSLHLYGCNVAAGIRGRRFLERLHRLTGAGILASSSCTGNLLMGGNWDLEQQIGPVCRRNILRPEVMATYNGML